jgi:hypothetical protein
MTVAAAGLKIVQQPTISEIESSEHETILNNLTRVEERDFGEFFICAGMNAAGALVVLANSMSGQFWLIGAVANAA